MRAPVSIGVLAIAAGGCVIDADHVSTRLVQVCTEDVPLLFSQESADLAVASIAVEDVGATVDDPDARATLDTVVLEARTGITDFSFASALRVVVIAPDSGLPDAEIAALSPLSGESPMTAAGDGAINLVDYLTSEMLTVRVELAGAAPVSSFSALFDACLDVEGIEIED